jgi:heme a synthase
MSDLPQVEQSLATVETPPGRWLHRWATLIIVMVWPLIWIGGLVTTFDAGMAVPDWPGTYGYNLFLYPYQTWLLGPFDLFIEHGHRLLAALVGFVAIIAVAVAFATEPRRWVRWLAVAVLIVVIAQGGLGGARVLLAERTLAMLHGCIAQAFFALCVALVVVTSRWWWMQVAGIAGYRPGRGLIAAVAVLMGLSYLQVLLGAQLRHVQPTASPTGFSHLVTTHIAIALIVLLMAAAVAWTLWSTARRWTVAAPDAVAPTSAGSKKKLGCGDLALSGPALLLLTFVVLQISLGLATWIARYGMPTFAQVGPRTASYLVKSQAFTESLIITGHVAIGAMVLVTSAFLLLRSVRARYARGPIAQSH